MTTISIIICTLDRPDMVQRCINSIVRAELDRVVEIILADQGPPGNNSAYCQRLADRGVPLTHLLLDRPGVQHARNAAIRQATGALLLFTDDDCIVTPDWAQAIRRGFADPSRHCVVGRVYPYGNVPGKLPCSILERPHPRLFRGNQFPFDIGVGNNMAFRRKLLQRIGGFDETLGAGTPAKACGDTEMFHRILKTGHTIAYQPEAVLYHDAWRTPEQVVGAAYSYNFGAAYYLFRCIRMGDIRSLGYLGGRLLGGALLAWLHFWIIGDPVRRCRAVQQFKGLWHGFLAGLRAPDPRISRIGPANDNRNRATRPDHIRSH